ncbi:hypothetical protein [Candidatus Thiosymbion oneisti]|uniref:hypothetical protein n=1 Tax=Candidatus Thiosymbion oneisti TaxID=589554 RepID=UPI000B7E45DD|nr:hypothetical protein [Candidatus Thiosymbion oneisti]
MEKHIIRLWILSFLVSVMAVAVMTYKWSNHSHPYEGNAHIIRNKSQLEGFLQSHRHRHDVAQFKTGHRPYPIPTAFFIQSLAFVTATDVNVTGFVWQTYPNDFPKDFEKGIVFAEQVNSADTLLTKSYELPIKRDGIQYDLVGWYFDVTVRQSFDYSHYPLDTVTVWLRLWSKQTSNDILLTPDFGAYKKTNKRTFGLDFEMVHGEWNVDETFFSYKEIPYDTNFGYYGPDPESSTSAEDYLFIDLFFNIRIHRKFIDAFIINLVPLFIVALLLFAQLLAVSRKKDLAEHIGFSVTGAIATYSAVLFIILLAHVQVRSQFAGSGLVYMEYFYLIMYLKIFLSLANTFIFVLGRSRYTDIIRYRDNLIPKLLYWPVLLWMLVIPTWLIL